MNNRLRQAIVSTILLAALASAALAAPPACADFEDGAGGWLQAGAAPPVREMGKQPVSVISGEAFGRSGKVAQVPLQGTSAGLQLPCEADLSRFRALRFDVFLPRAPGRMHVAACFVDDGDFWFQTWHRVAPRPGRWETVEIDIRPEAAELEPVGHARPWGPYVARSVRQIGLRVFADRAVQGQVLFDNIRLIPAASGMPPQEVYNFETSGDEVRRFERFEITFELQRTYENPFDPSQIDVRAEFRGPDGAVVTVPGFFYQDYERRLDRKRELLIPVGPPKWKVRFAPRLEGHWTYEVVIFDGDTLRLGPGAFHCAPGEGRGFVQVAGDKNHFEFSGGEFFYPIGHNIPATYNEKGAALLDLAIEPHEGTFAYDRFLEGMARGEENYARIWLGAWSFALEWSREYDRQFAGAGRYSQENAWRLDYVVQKAERLDVYVQLALTTFGHWRSEEFEGDWKWSPYNSANGGRLKRPQQFWSDELSQETYQRMVRYVAARWGYSTHIAAWELSNEIDLVTGYPQHKAEVIAWHRRCAETLAKCDPNRHLVTTNFAVWNNEPEILQMPEISFSSTNNYTIQIVDAMRKRIYPLKSTYDKPAIMAECGYDFKGAEPDTTERYLHICLWGSHMTPFAGAGLSWWWDFIDDRDLYERFRPLARFAAGEDRRGRNLQMASGQAFQADGSAIAALLADGLANESSGYFWIYERDLLRSEAAPDFVPVTRKGLTLEWKGLRDGAYEVEFWDTRKGEVVQALPASSRDGALRCAIPEFAGDIAGKIKLRAVDKPAAPETLPAIDSPDVSN